MLNALCIYETWEIWLADRYVLKIGHNATPLTSNWVKPKRTMICLQEDVPKKCNSVEICPKILTYTKYIHSSKNEKGRVAAGAPWVEPPCSRSFYDVRTFDHFKHKNVNMWNRDSPFDFQKFGIFAAPAALYIP